MDLEVVIRVLKEHTAFNFRAEDRENMPVFH
jgi:hypothetical protein